MTLGFSTRDCKSFAKENGMEIIESEKEDKDIEQKQENKSEEKKIPWTTAILIVVLLCGAIDVLFLNKSTNISNLRRKKRE